MVTDPLYSDYLYTIESCDAFLKAFVHDGYLHWVLICHCIFCCISIGTTTVCLKMFANNYFHTNCKILVNTLFISYIVHSVFMGAIQVYQLYLYFFTSGCDILVHAATCTAFRAITSFCSFLFSSLHFSMSIERWFALHYGGSYEKKSTTIGIWLLIFSVLLSLLMITYSLHKVNLAVYLPYCSIVTRDTQQNTEEMLILMLVMDLISVFNLLFMRHRGRRKRIENASLTIAFSAVERHTATSLLLPLAALHCISGIFFELSNITILHVEYLFFDYITFKTFMAGLNVFPFYSTASCILFAWLLRSHRCAKITRLRNATKQIIDPIEVHRTYSSKW